MTKGKKLAALKNLIKGKKGKDGDGDGDKGKEPGSDAPSDTKYPFLKKFAKK